MFRTINPGVVLIIWAALIGIATILFTTGIYADRNSQGAPTLQVEDGHWAEPSEPNPRGWDCLLWVNNNDSDVAEMWCATERRKGTKTEKAMENKGRD